MKITFRLLLAQTFLALNLFAQKGDKTGEDQTPLVPAEKIPPSPILSPADALKSFKLQPGFRIELVASEPMVNEPTVIQWDANGRMWVVEFQGFMPDSEGHGEEKPVGSVVILEDTDGDGKMDKRSVFLDHIVMPRALLLMKDGVLVAEPPHLWFYKVENDRAGERMEIAADYAREADITMGLRANIEHAANSLTWGMDNWIYSANYTGRFRHTDEVWKREATSFRGQWGMSQDDSGRLVYNSNSDQFRIDLAPSRYLGRNPNYRTAAGLNVDPIRNQATFPARVTPGVNRGYQKGTLRPDGTLEKFTAACGPVIYHGKNFPREFWGNAFVCEPSANLVKRDILSESNGVLSGRQAYDHEEFLASTDEWFRPVNAYSGPDGALYIADIHHGIIQHRYFLTSYLRKQAESRGMDKAVRHLGRIYRIVYEAGKLDPKPALEGASTAKLVEALSHPNGWWRDTAQKILVQGGASDAVAPLQKIAMEGSDPAGRLHALWALEGLDRLELSTVLKGIADQNSKVKAAAIRLSEAFLKTEDRDDVIGALVRQVSDGNFEVQLQLALTLGEIPGAKAEEAMTSLAEKSGDNIYIRDALLTGLGRRELEILQRLVADPKWVAKTAAREQFLGGLARCVFTEGRTNRVNDLFRLALTAPTWQQAALIDAVASIAPTSQRGKAAVKLKPVLFTSEPDGFLSLVNAKNPALTAKLKKIGEMITWPGQPGYVPPPVVKPLNAEQQKQFETGRDLFASSCAACHQPHGLGQEGLAPPLADSEWALGSEQRLIRIALNGVRGPISVKGRKYELEMPGLGIFPDDQLAAILTYIRREWGHGADPITTEAVKAIRDADKEREEAWSEPELLKIK